MLPCFVTKYSYWRIRQIFHDDYALDLVRVIEYKGTRYGKPTRYDLVNELGEVELSYVTLDALREYLTTEGYPLKKPDT